MGPSETGPHLAKQKSDIDIYLHMNYLSIYLSLSGSILAIKHFNDKMRFSLDLKAVKS